MLTKNRIAWLFLLPLAIAFIYGMYALFALRFEEGEMFPVYSSLRTDPLGVKGFYQALESLPGVTTERHYQGLNKLKTDDGNLTLLCLGLSSRFLDQDQDPATQQMEDLVRKGARIILSFTPAIEKSPSKNERSSCEPQRLQQPAPEADAQQHNDGTSPENSERRATASEKWSVQPFTAPHRERHEPVMANIALQNDAGDLPRSLSIHTDLYFETSDPGWQPLYAVNQQPVIIERRLGAGSLVLVADGYLFSNEAMRDARSPSLLSRLIGPNNRIVFDEFHFGVREHPGIMDLVRKHRLVWFLVAVMALALLFMWKNAIPFSSAPQEQWNGNLPISMGKDQLSGLIHLLRRNIQPRHALKVCFDEWDKAIGQSSPGLQEKRARIKQIIEMHQNQSKNPQPVTEAYNQITRILSEKKAS